MRSISLPGGAGTGISKSEVSRIRADLDPEAAVFGDRSLAGQGLPYVFLDETYIARPRASPPGLL